MIVDQADCISHVKGDLQVPGQAIALPVGYDPQHSFGPRDAVLLGGGLNRIASGDGAVLLGGEAPKPAGLPRVAAAKA